MIVAPGVIHLLEIQFPPGPQAYLHLTINHGLSQLWPSNPEEDFASDSVTIRTREFYELPSKETELKFHTWNLDDTYEHSVIIRIGILPKAVIAPYLLTWRDKLIGFTLGYE